VVSFENQLKLKKWAATVVTNNFNSLYDIYQGTQSKVAGTKGKTGYLVSAIGSSIAWLGSGASYLVSSGDDGGTPGEDAKKDE